MFAEQRPDQPLTDLNLLKKDWIASVLWQFSKIVQNNFFKEPLIGCFQKKGFKNAIQSHTPLSWMHILLVCMTQLFHAHTFNHSINTLAMHSYVDYVVDQ